MKPQIREQFLDHYDRYADAIYRHCFFRVFSKGIAEELMQETFMKTWEYLDDGHEVENLRAFLYKVANNLIIDYARKKKEQSLDQLVEEHPAAEPADTTSEAAMDRAVLMRDVRESLEKLPAQPRELIVMRYLDDLDPKDIALILDITPNHASVKLNRAMQLLKEQFLP